MEPLECHKERRLTLRSVDIPHSLSASGSNIYLVSSHKALLKGVKLRVTTIDHTTGKPLDDTTLSSDSTLSATSDLLAVGVTGSKPVVVWTDASHQMLKVNVLGSKNIVSFDIKSTNEKVDRIIVHGSTQPSAMPHFLVHYQAANAHWAEVFHVDVKKSTVSKAYDLTKLGGHGTFSASAVNANIYFVRTTTDEVILVSSASHGILGRWPIKSVDANKLFEYDMQPYSVHSASEVVPRATGSYAVRCAVLLPNGKWVMIQNGESKWSRPEMLAGIRRAEWVENTDIDNLSEELEAETHINGLSASLHRFKRHLQQLQDIPSIFANLRRTSLEWAYAFIDNHKGQQSQAKTFGFDKKVLVETDNGVISLLDPSLPDKVDFQWINDESSLELTLNEHLRRKLHKARPSKSSPKDNEVDRSQQTSYGIVDGALQGRQGTNSIWHYMPAKDQKIVDITSPLRSEAVASIGKVLGDRRVLYKYLNPNSILVKATDDVRKLLVITVLNSASGSVLYSATHQGVDTNRPMTSVVSENWIAYSFTASSSKESSSRGHQLVMAEFYESDLPNDRGPLGATSNYSAIAPPIGSVGTLKPHVYAQSFHTPEEISHMTVTQTKQGITSRDLLVTLADSNGIVGIPRQFLDPRRPVDKDPSSQQQMEEGLMRYFPLVDFDPKWYITHKNEVIGIENIIITPSSMESTSLIFAYGLDVFSTRVNPSFPFDILGNSFNKHQLILTVIALTAAAFAVAPFVQKKQTNGLWQNT